MKIEGHPIYLVALATIKHDMDYTNTKAVYFPFIYKGSFVFMKHKLTI
jgi:hypothetical protein